MADLALAVFDFVVCDNLDGLGLAAFAGAFFAGAALAPLEAAVLATGFLDLEVDIDPQRR